MALSMAGLRRLWDVAGTRRWPLQTNKQPNEGLASTPVGGVKERMESTRLEPKEGREEGKLL